MLLKCTYGQQYVTLYTCSSILCANALGIRAIQSSKHRLSINRPTKRGKEKSPSDGHCQCEKEMDDHLLSCQQIYEREPPSDALC
jgi:hypothetical protein